jgi:arylsulfatase A
MTRSVRSACFALATLLLAPHAVAGSRAPNSVIVFTDDQGYADVGCFGAAVDLFR